MTKQDHQREAISRIYDTLHELQGCVSERYSDAHCRELALAALAEASSLALSFAGTDPIGPTLEHVTSAVTRLHDYERCEPGSGNRTKALKSAAVALLNAHNAAEGLAYS